MKWKKMHQNKTVWGLMELEASTKFVRSFNKKNKKLLKKLCMRKICLIYIDCTIFSITSYFKQV